MLNPSTLPERDEMSEVFTAMFVSLVLTRPEREAISAVLVAMFPVAVARFELVVLRLVLVVARFELVVLRLVLVVARFELVVAILPERLATVGLRAFCARVSVK